MSILTQEKCRHSFPKCINCVHTLRSRRTIPAGHFPHEVFSCFSIHVVGNDPDDPVQHCEVVCQGHWHQGSRVLVGGCLCVCNVECMMENANPKLNNKNNAILLDYFSNVVFLREKSIFYLHFSQKMSKFNQTRAFLRSFFSGNT